MAAAGLVNVQQAELWNSSGARGWTEAQESLDRLFKPFEDRIAAAVTARQARVVLDVGCGTGATTLAVARRLGAAGSATGIDFAAPMIAQARARAERAGSSARFICGDAQTHAFEAARHDMIVSRFGVMFFDDPVAAFANLKRAAVAGGAFHAIAWRDPEENEFMTAATRAAAPLLPPQPPQHPHSPGQFAFADRDRVRGLLAQGGWREIGIERLDVPCVLSRGELQIIVTRLGPVGRACMEADETTRARLLEAVLPAFEPFRHGDALRFTAACWAIRAVA